MNCKPGDIARIVGDDLRENINRIVSVGCRCQHFYDEPRWDCVGLQGLRAYREPYLPPADVPAGVSVCIPDAFLRPLHDGDGEDEMLRIAGKPVDDLALIPAPGRVAA